MAAATGQALEMRYRTLLANQVQVQEQIQKDRDMKELYTRRPELKERQPLRITKVVSG